MPTIVGILTFISMINTTSERLKEQNFSCQYFKFYESLCSAELSMKKVFFTLGPDQADKQDDLHLCFHWALITWVTSKSELSVTGK